MRVERGVTLVEAALSTAILGTLAVASLNAVGASVVTRERSVERVRGQQLADSLLEHACSLAYEEEGTDLLGVITIGLDLDDALSTNWGEFDDVDDFDLWKASPPEDAGGTALAGFDGSWQRSVEVEWVDARTLEPVSADEGVKRVTVTVTRDRRVVARAVGVRTRGADLLRDGELDNVNETGGSGGTVGGLLDGVTGLLGL